MPSSSVVVIHSSSPKRDYEILVDILPRRFQSDDTGDFNNGSSSSSSSSRSYSFVAPSTSVSNDDTSSGMINDNSGDTIILLPTMKISSNGSVNGGSITGTIEHEFETVSLTNNTMTNTNKNTNINTNTTSFAVLILNNTDEFRLMTELISEKEGLLVEESKIEKALSSLQKSSSSLAKFVLPGGCLVTLTTSHPWTNNNTRRKVVEFMTTPITDKTTPSTFLSETERISNNNSKKSRTDSMRRSMSMSDIIPPMVTTNKNNYSGSSNNIENNNIRRNNAIIPTLQSKVLSFDGKYQSVPLNSQTSFPIETELFTGRLLLIIRPSDDPAKVDPYWNERIFSKKKRRVVMQLQGKLKYKPKGKIYAGMEISDPMKLGLIANGLCNIILKMTKSFNPLLHYSFGTKDERAHICFPASTFFERLVVTPPDETPPEMGIEFVELPDAVADRKAYKTQIDWNTDDTYSMSFYTQYIDFPTWSVVSLPVGRDISLQTFWGNSFASVVLYEVDKDQDEYKPHLTESNRYLLGLRFKHLGKDGTIAPRQSSNAALLEQQDEFSEGGEGSEWSGDESRHVSEGESISTAGDLALMPAFDEEYVMDDDEDNTTEFYDTMESLPAGGAGEISSLELMSTSSHNTLLSVIDTYCPCWIDMFSKRGKYVQMYAFCNGGTKRQQQHPLFRTSDLAEEIFKGREIAEVDDRFSNRVSSAERTRRILGLKYADANVHKRNQTQLQLFHKVSCRFDARFLRRKEPMVKKVGGIKSGYVARALSDRHWKEERMVLLDDGIIFHHVEGSKTNFRISLSSVIDVSVPENTDLLPLPSYHYLQVETFVRVTYLMFRSEEERNSWALTLDRLLETRGSVRSFSKELIQSDDPVHEFLSKSTMWSCQKRKILNCRRHSFRTTRSKTPEDTLRLAERALAKVLSLNPKGGANDSDLRDFLDCASSLKDADAHSLNEEEKMSFFLNVYHIMIMHSYIILGPPVSGPEWISYFNTIAYQCSDDILYVFQNKCSFNLLFTCI